MTIVDQQEEEVIVGSDDSHMIVSNIPYRAHNISGVLNKHSIIVAPADDSLKRDFGIYELFNANDPQTKYFAWFVRPDAPKKSAIETFLAHYEVIKNAEGDVHIPSLVAARPIKKFHFGMDNIQQSEHDADWRRPAMILKMPAHCVFLVAVRTLSPTASAPSWLALAVGYGLVNALNSLHEKGFIHRFVTPWNFMVPMPFTMDNITKKMIIMDLSLAKRWDPDSISDVSVRFSGTVKYSSLRALNFRTVGPADDLISVIFIVAELISGKIPWRSVSKFEKCIALRQKFAESIEFRRLPRELRKLYTDLCNTSPADCPAIDNVKEAFESALKRRDGDDWSIKPMPDWLEMPTE
ncbi:hypothetical protein niasHS_005826 [Heterodera schachtii]|uniref:Protein kinase domain-containing protein n=1 Tax=Heterodera schachtii TaxID=97005 RepID=A0ABD2JZL1_HETSC